MIHYRRQPQQPIELTYPDLTELQTLYVLAYCAGLLQESGLLQPFLMNNPYPSHPDYYHHTRKQLKKALNPITSECVFDFVLSNPTPQELMVESVVTAGEVIPFDVAYVFFHLLSLVQQSVSPDDFFAFLTELQAILSPST